MTIYTLQDWERCTAEEMLQKLQKHKVLRFKGNFGGASDFKKWSERLLSVGGFLTHHSPSIRRQLLTNGGRPDASTTNVLEGTHAVALHSEFGYRARVAGKRCDALLFSGLDVSDDLVGGETLIAPGNEVLKAMPSGLRTRLIESRVIYEMHLTRRTFELLRPGEDWTQATVGRFLVQEGYEGVTRFSGELATYRQTNAAVEEHDGELFFVNSIVNTATSQKLPPEKPTVLWEDGSKIRSEDIEEIHRVQEACAFPVRLGSGGDTLVIDNARMMHGRRAWDGTRREIATRFLSINRTLV